MNREIKELTTLLSAFLSALYLAFQSVGLMFDWFNPDTIAAWVMAFGSLLTLLTTVYGIYKNSYVLTEKARDERKVLDTHEYIKPSTIEVDDNE